MADLDDKSERYPRVVVAKPNFTAAVSSLPNVRFPPFAGIQTETPATERGRLSLRAKRLAGGSAPGPGRCGRGPRRWKTGATRTTPMWVASGCRPSWGNAIGRPAASPCAPCLLPCSSVLDS